MNYSASLRAPTVYIVRSIELLHDEVFDNRENAVRFASAFSDASVENAPIRNGSDQLDVITERRAVVSEGVVLVDSTTTTLNFRDRSVGLFLPDADVEGYYCGLGHRHIIAFGNDRMVVLDRAQRAIDSALRLGDSLRDW